MIDDESAGAALPHQFLWRRLPRSYFDAAGEATTATVVVGRDCAGTTTTGAPVRGNNYCTTTPTPRPNQPMLSWWKSKRPSGRCICQPIISPSPITPPGWLYVPRDRCANLNVYLAAAAPARGP
jgi:hypothetical protein